MSVRGGHLMMFALFCLVFPIGAETMHYNRTAYFRHAQVRLFIPDNKKCLKKIYAGICKISAMYVHTNISRYCIIYFITLCINFCTSTSC